MVTTGQDISITASSSAWGHGLTGVIATVGVITALSVPAAEDITVVVATTAEEAMAAGAMAAEAAMAEVAGMVAEVELPVAGLVAEDAVVAATVAVVAMVAVVTANSEQIQIRHGGASAAPPCFFDRCIRGAGAASISWLK